ncbi:uncharacterized protein E0L32_009945 [Thyridium curvatum]|uniref:Uncharacterized protein n=1 Tax=Thyridium curvatum TaxID=1093900 RepID=A0A507APF8_9PEZI|nr:uncharacterized protein E0L32_009945 [Thyridium curvatum]TPX08606.1 hypothetical protein E0L32_009945 [Thyridium curvatum]
MGVKTKLMSNNPFASKADRDEAGDSSTALPPPSNSGTTNNIPDDLPPPPSYEDAVAGSSRLHLQPPPPTPSASRPPKRSSQQYPLPPLPPSGPSSSSPGGLPPPPRQPASAAAGPIARQFPPAFNVYSDGWGRSFVLGEHQGAPLYAVRLHSGWSGEPDVVLHNGPSADRCPMLAAVDMHSFGGDMTASLPPMPGGGGGGGGGMGGTEVHIDADYGGWHRTYRFQIEVGRPGGGGPVRREAFEWRHSYGDAIASLGGSSHGWKLVRVAKGPPPGAPEGSGFVPGGYVTSDGCEVVAAWTDATMSMSKSAKFTFLGTGNSGLLGERWAVMAVVSALGLWEKERRNNRRRHHT